MSCSVGSPGLALFLCVWWGVDVHIQEQVCVKPKADAATRGCGSCCTATGPQGIDSVASACCFREVRMSLLTLTSCQEALRRV